MECPVVRFRDMDFKERGLKKTRSMRNMDMEKM